MPMGKTAALEYFDFIEAQRRQLKEQIARATLRAVRVERLLLTVEKEVETIVEDLKKDTPPSRRALRERI